MNSQTQGPVPRSELYQRPVFDGFPYLVSRVYPALYHIIVLPRDRTEEELLFLAERQVTANRLETFLALGHRQGMNYGCDGVGSPASHLPRCTAFVCDKLQPAEAFPQTPELVSRIGRLHAYIEALQLKGYLVPDSRRWERPGAPEELARLSGFGPRGTPLGLEPCSVCGQPRGVCRREGTEGNIVTVSCLCDNHNRCARCGEGLDDHSLNAFYYDEGERRIYFTPGFCGLSHRCPGEGGARLPNGRQR